VSIVGAILAVVLLLIFAIKNGDSLCTEAAKDRRLLELAVILDNKGHLVFELVLSISFDEYVVVVRG